MTNLRPLLSLSALALLLTACSDPPAEDTESTESELGATSCRGLVGTDAAHYAADAPNVARELASSLGGSFVTNGSAFIPGVLRATSSTSPYAYAATLELGAWSSMSTSSFDLASSPGELYVWVGGSPSDDARGHKAAKALFDAMTNASQTAENGAVVRRSSKKSVTCAQYPGSYQCVLGPFGHVQQSASCPK